MRQRFSLSVAVFIIIKNDSKILLIRRFNTGWKDGNFSLPAGSHDGNETLVEAAIRELKEETSLTVTGDDLALAHIMHVKTGDTNKEWLGAFFMAKKWKGSPKIMEPENHDLLDWYSINDLPIETIEYTKQGIEMALNNIAFSTYGW